MTRSKAYSLKEFFVFIGFICVLFSISVSLLYAAQEDARFAKAQADVITFKRAALVAVIETDAPIQRITGNTCSDCICVNGLTDQCVATQIKAIDSIIHSTNGIVELHDTHFTDPWGTTFFIKELGRRMGNRCDALIYSAGKDKNILTTKDNVSAWIEDAC
jgi:hypothetical protein